VVWVFARPRFEPRLVGKRWASAKDIRREIRYSLSTAVIFSLVGAGVRLGGRAGVFRFEESVLARGVAYEAFATAALVVLHDAYFYWTHRAHHLSHDPSPWAAYAFGPIEAVIQAAYVPLVLLVLPADELALFLFLAFMIVRYVIGHAGAEMFSRGFVRGPLAFL